MVYMYMYFIIHLHAVSLPQLYTFLILFQITLHQERTKHSEMERRFGEIASKKKREIDQLSSQLVEARQRMTKNVSSGKQEEKGASQVNEMQIRFLKQAVYQLLTGIHAEEHLRAISSILNFTPQERKEVYAEFQENKGRTRHLH